MAAVRRNRGAIMELTDSTTDQTWNYDQIAERISSSLGDIVAVRGLDSTALQQRVERLGEAIDAHGAVLLAVDPSGGRDGPETMREVTAEYARRAGDRAEDTDRIHRLLDVVTGVRPGPGEAAGSSLAGGQIRGAIVELWEILSEQCPAVLLVLHPDEMGADDRSTVEALVEAHFVDTVGSLVPELDVPDGVDYSIVFGEPDTDLPWCLEAARTATVDVTGEARRAIREQLAEDAVVDRFVATTGGDPARLAEFVESLPANGESYWRFRYRQLEADGRALVDALAVAERALPVATLRRVLDHHDSRSFDSTLVRELRREGYLRRRFDDGAMRLELADVDLRRGLLEEMDRGRRIEFHRAIAEASAADQVTRLDDGFLARHFLAAGDVDKGFDYGMRAARKLHATHSMEAARELFERLLEHGVGSEDVAVSTLDRIRWYLVDILSDLGEVEAAFEHARALEAHLEEGPDLWQLRRKRARLRARVGEHEEAERIVGELTDAIGVDDHPDAWAAARQVAAQAAYARGNEQSAEKAAREAIEALDEQRLNAGGPASETLVEARNLLGRIALFHRDEQRARKLFESNRETAAEWNWHREVTRAELNLAILEIQAGRFAEAVEAIEELLDRSPTPTPQRKTRLLVNLGLGYQKRGSLEQALEAYRGAFRAARRAEDDATTGVAAYNLATLCQDFGAYDRVVSLVDWLREQRIDEESHRFVGTLPELVRANALLEKGEYGEALQAVDSVVDSMDSASEALPAAKFELRATFAHIHRGEVDRARERLEQVELPDEIPPESAPVGLRRLGEAFLAHADGESPRAAELAAQAEEALFASGHFQDGLRASTVRIRALQSLDRADEAEELVERRLVEFGERAESVPSEFRATFHAIPVYRRLAELGEELLGGLPEGLHEPLDTAPADVSETEADAEIPRADVRRLRRRFPDIVGQDESLIRLLARIDQVADSDAPVLIQGESGVGKELVAKALHRESPRGQAGAPFVKVNCGAFVDNLLLSELFGHEKGAFTGAVEQKRGCFERADGGTILLDEIGEVSAKAQVALLRVLQEGEFERVGGTQTRTSDVRIVCATNRDLAEMVETDAFRLDLYYRLKGILLEVPPLRERRGDIPRLARHFARRATDGREIDFSREVLEFLASYRWPGNVRELRHLVESILSFVDGGLVEMRHLREFRDFFAETEMDLKPPEIDYESTPLSVGGSQPPPAADPARSHDGCDPESQLVEDILEGERDLRELKKTIQKRAVEQALETTEGNITRAADLLEMSRPRISQIVNGDEELLALKEQLVT